MTHLSGKSSELNFSFNFHIEDNVWSKFGGVCIHRIVYLFRICLVVLFYFRKKK